MLDSHFLLFKEEAKADGKELLREVCVRIDLISEIVEEGENLTKIVMQNGNAYWVDLSVQNILIRSNGHLTCVVVRSEKENT